MKRLAVYATYNPKGVVDEYIIYMAESLKKVADDIYIVSNHTYLDGEKEKLEAASRIYERADKGYDAGGYAHVIRLLEKENKLAGYDELILLNDSIFGPFYPLEDIFYEMERNTKIDFCLESCNWPKGKEDVNYWGSKVCLQVRKEKAFPTQVCFL